MKKGIKKAISATAAAVMLFGIVPFSAFAETGLESAIIAAKNKISIPAECTEFDSSSSQDDNGVEYSLSWQTKRDEGDTQKTYSVRINDKGDVLSFHKWEISNFPAQNNRHMGFAKFSEDEAMRLAKEWLFSVNPNWKDEFPDEAITYNSSLYGNSVDVRLGRVINGLDFCGDSVSVELNKETGDVESMSAQYTYASDIPSVDTAISAADAENKFFEASPMELKYIKVDNKAILIYMPKNAYYELDGITGEEFKPFEYGYSSGGAGDSNGKSENAMDSAADTGKQLTDAELKNIEEVNGLLSTDELRKIAENIKNIGIEDLEFISGEYYLDGYYPYTDTENETPKSYKARLYYAPKNNADKYYGNLSIELDAKDGSLENFSNYIYAKDSDKQDNKTQISFDTANTKAKDFIKTYSSVIDNVKLSENAEDYNNDRDSEYYMDFERYENNIVFPENRIYITVDNKTGNIKTYYKVWDNNIEFESSDGIIGAEKAQTALSEKAKMTLSYDKTESDNKTVPKITLKYSLEHNGHYQINAKSGALLDYDGSEYTSDELVLPTDISGHYAEKQIKKLFECGVLSLNKGEDTFRPNDNITVGELADMLNSTFIRPIPIYLLNADAKSNDSGTEDSNNAITTRQDAAKAIIYAAGLEQAAKLRGIFTTGYYDEADINPEYLGSVALCRGMGVMSGDENNYFNPTATLSRADAAIIIYNYLSK